jgi:hypothetical protein
MGVVGRAIPPASMAQMTDFRLYVIGSDGHFVRAIHLDCPDDSAAIELAKQHIGSDDMELWQRDRLIAKFDRKPE